MARPIVQDTSRTTGRYCLEGTDIPVAQIKKDYLAGADVKYAYQFIGLTEEECDLIQTFPFPPTRDVNLRQIYISAVLECPCGEEQALYGSQEPQTIITCICGRSWKIELSVAPTSQMAEADHLNPDLVAHVNDFNREHSLVQG